MKLLLFLVLAISAYQCFGYPKKPIDSQYEVKNKVIIVTGAARGIGYAIADNFLEKGAKIIIILDIDVPKGRDAATTLNAKYGKNSAVFIKCDVTKDLDEVSQLILRNYDVDILVNCAGVVNEFDPRKTLTTNSIALIEWSLKFREYMRKDNGGKGGTIINISSVYGYTIDPFLVSYKASKFAVLGFSKSLGHELNYKITGVRVLVICPGTTDTRLAKNVKEFPEHNELFTRLTDKSQKQSADVVGRGVVEVYKSARTGTAWDIIGGRPPVESPLAAYASMKEILDS
ncbi:15-hydroxyprostaglandin dehydrogenase [NAD(+)] [Bombyx mori]|uniref:Alcohol dehydrogenase n=1 Tax=Bombyx mori TaxID=7091 RepID=A0A8R2AJG4_BOMMO|nr:15-hydroxyprostaglandin dehydrogenase [NAD(+)] [Bombyx mori]